MYAYLSILDRLFSKLTTACISLMKDVTNAIIIMITSYVPMLITPNFYIEYIKTKVAYLWSNDQGKKNYSLNTTTSTLAILILFRNYLFKKIILITFD